MSAGMDIVSTNGSHHSTHTTDDSREDYISATISLRILRAAIRRRWRLWVLIAIAGVLIGSSLHLALPRTVSAVTRVVLVEPNTAPASDEMANDVTLLETPGVAKAVIATLPPSLKGTSGSYRGLALSSNILAITAKESSAAAAVTLDNVVANVFLAARAQTSTAATNAVVAGLQLQIQAAQTQIAALTSQIAKIPSTSDQYGPLESELSTDKTNVSNLQGQLEQANGNLKAEITGSYVLDRATPGVSKTKKVTIEDALSGLIVGLALGLGFVVVSEILSDRLRWRADVARALDAPVELSVGRYRRYRLARKARLRWRLNRPSRTLVMMERRLRARFQATPHQALVAISLDAAEPAGLAVASLARSLAAEGRRVLLIDMAEGRPLAALFGVSRQGGVVHATEVSGHPVTLIVSPADPAQLGLEADPNEIDAVLVLASAEPAFGADHIAAWAKDAVVVITAGAVSASRIHGTGQMLRQAGISVRSAILVGTDRADDSVGVVNSGAALWESAPALEALPAGSW